MSFHGAHTKEPPPIAVWGLARPLSYNKTHTVIPNGKNSNLALVDWDEAR